MGGSGKAGSVKNEDNVSRLEAEFHRLEADLAAARERIKELEKYAPPAMFEGTEIVWDDVTEARELARELIRLAGVRPSDQMLRRYPWLKGTGQG